MTPPDMSRVTWRKSTRSGNGGACVEVATLEDDAWRKSTRSGNGGDCVEVASRRRVIAVRDSKDPGGPHLDFDPAVWAAFLADLKGRQE